jgi:hypothetical protein
MEARLKKFSTCIYRSREGPSLPSKLSKEPLNNPSPPVPMKLSSILHPVLFKTILPIRRYHLNARFGLADPATAPLGGIEHCVDEATPFAYPPQHSKRIGQIPQRIARYVASARRPPSCIMITDFSFYIGFSQ